MTVQVGVEGAAKGLDRAQLGKAIGEGLQRGITQVAIESAAQKAGVDPLTSALTSRAITGAIDGLLTSGPKVGDKAGGVMKGIFDAYTKSTLNTMSLGGAPEAGNPYSQAVYASKVKDFGDIVRQRGLPQALETYATGIFMRDSLDSIVRSGDEFGKQVQEKLKKGEYKKVPLKDESIGKAVDLPATRPTNIDKAKSAAISNASKGGTLGEEYKGLGEAISGVDYALIFDAQDNLMGIKEGPRYRQGKFGTLPGTDKVILTDGTDTQALDDKAVTQTTISGNKPSKVSVLTPEQEDLLKPVKFHTPLTLRPVDEGTPIKFNEKGEITDGTLEGADYKITLRDGIIQEERRKLSLLNENEVISQDIFLQTRRNADGKQQDRVEVSIPKILDPTKIKGPVKEFEEFKRQGREVVASNFKETADKAIKTLEKFIMETGVVPDIYLTVRSDPMPVIETPQINIVREEKASLFFKGMEGSKVGLEADAFTGEVKGVTVKFKISNPFEKFLSPNVPKQTREIIFPINPNNTGVLPTLSGGVNFKTTIEGRLVAGTTFTGEISKDNNLDGKRTFTFEQKGISQGSEGGLLVGQKYTITMDEETYRDIQAVGVGVAITAGIYGGAQALQALGVPARVAAGLGTLREIGGRIPDAIKAAGAVEAARVAIGAIKIEEKDQVN